MSVATARVQRSPRPASVEPTPRLRLVRPPEYVKARVPLTLGLIGLLAASLIVSLLLNTSMAAAAFETTALQKELSAVEQDNDELRTSLDAQSSPENLAAQARALGMVPATGTGWIRLSDSTVAGAPDPARP
jgi:hypothetical protein